MDTVSYTHLDVYKRQQHAKIAVLLPKHLDQCFAGYHTAFYHGEQDAVQCQSRIQSPTYLRNGVQQLCQTWLLYTSSKNTMRFLKKPCHPS